MRCSIGGCDPIHRPSRRLACDSRGRSMHRARASSLIRGNAVSAATFSKARRSPPGSRVYCTAEASASSSRRRDNAAFSSCAAGTATRRKTRAKNSAPSAKTPMNRPVMPLPARFGRVDERSRHHDRDGRQYDDRPNRVHGHDEDTRVAVADVGELVGDHTGELAAVDDGKEPARHHDGAVLPAVRNGVGVARRIVEHEHVRHRYPGGDCDLLDDVAQHRVLGTLGLVDAVARDHRLTRQQRRERQVGGNAEAGEDQAWDVEVVDGLANGAGVARLTAVDGDQQPVDDEPQQHEQAGDQDAGSSAQPALRFEEVVIR